ncbi:hypothetical protein ABMA28_016228 [Loxostege sticticalis]|uniref:PDZ domain-containing protein n=1 Tax=Loxostege sticticalis TaxID=481309 RepID=A0ABD0T838_LOXSC
MRLSILVPPRAKLGCGICKGPDWKPGIFVQFVREGGIAQEAGLRPGDQILSCNGQDFANISFNEAISAMKAVGRLELVIREGAGTELVSPESSGYNSSASSAAGERSPAPTVVPLAPPAALRRRLASVAEEAADRADRLTMNRLKRRTWDSLEFDWKEGDVHSFDIDAPSDIEPDYDSPSIPNNPHTFENKHNLRNKSKKDFVTTPSNRTIINLTEDGATIQCSYDNQSPRKSTFTANHTSRDNEKKTIVVEVHHTGGPPCPKAHYPPAPKKDDLDSSSMSSSATLSSAIAEEIQRRKLNKKNTNSAENNAVTSPPKKPSVPKIINNNDNKKKQHDALMDEFKKVHRKMFANQDDTTAKEGTETEANSLDRQQTLPLRKAEYEQADVTTNNHTPPKREATDNPPPPPPMPTANGHQNGHAKAITNNGPIIKPVLQEILKTQTLRNGTLTRTPTPDYNNKADSAHLKLKSKDEKAELESLESYKLKNPVNAPPKPPSNYFMRAPNGTATMKKLARPVSVTIGEYAGGGGGRREPTKLDFLNGDKPDGAGAPDDVPITNRLQSELAMTLSRSNLRKKTEALADAGR